MLGQCLSIRFIVYRLSLLIFKLLFASVTIKDRFWQNLPIISSTTQQLQDTKVPFLPAILRVGSNCCFPGGFLKKHPRFSLSPTDLLKAEEGSVEHALTSFHTGFGNSEGRDCGCSDLRDWSLKGVWVKIISLGSMVPFSFFFRMALWALEGVWYCFCWAQSTTAVCFWGKSLAWMFAFESRWWWPVVLWWKGQSLEGVVSLN